eukprot:Ihof_evm6s252 gene=Ihof_evmTU6s252
MSSNISVVAWKRRREIAGSASLVAPRNINEWCKASSQLRFCNTKNCTKSHPINASLGAAFSCDGERFATSHGGDHAVRVWSYPSGQNSQTLLGHPRTPWSVQFHPTNPYILASGCIGGHVCIWDLKKVERIRHVTLPQPIGSMSFDHDGDCLAIGSGLNIYFWRYNSNTRPDPYIHKRASGIIRWVGFHPTSQILLIGVTNTPIVQPVVQPGPSTAPSNLQETPRNSSLPSHSMGVVLTDTSNVHLTMNITLQSQGGYNIAGRVVRSRTGSDRMRVEFCTYGDTEYL